MADKRAVSAAQRVLAATPIKQFLRKRRILIASRSRWRICKLLSLRFWLQELRTPELLIRVAATHQDECAVQLMRRPLLSHAISADFELLSRALLDEELRERALDRAYWLPLKAELEQFRHQR